MLGQQALVEPETAPIRLVPDRMDGDLEATAVRLQHATIDLAVVEGHEALLLGMVAEGSAHARGAGPERPVGEDLDPPHPAAALRIVERRPSGGGDPLHVGTDQQA